MKQVLILVGVSGSGKSTFAINHLRENPDWVRINRDQARLMLVGDLKGYYTSGTKVKDIEAIVTEMEAMAILHSYRGKGYNVIVDNTNLDVNRYAYYFGLPSVDVKFKLFDVEEVVAQNRVRRRDDLNLEQVTYIEKQAKQYEQAKAWILKNHKEKIV